MYGFWQLLCLGISLLGAVKVCMVPSLAIAPKPGVLAKTRDSLTTTCSICRTVTGMPRERSVRHGRRRRRCLQHRAVPHDQGALDPPFPFDFGRYASELHTSLHAALAPTSRASQQPCRATPKPALTKPARPSSHRVPCSSRRDPSCRRAHSLHWTASS